MSLSPCIQRDVQAAHGAMRLMDKRSMPGNAFIPLLNYLDVRAAVDWLCKAFGFHERLRIADHRAHLGMASEDIVVRRGVQPLSPIDRSTHAVMIRIDNLKLHHQRATSAGASVVSPPTTYPYGERQYTAGPLGSCLDVLRNGG